MTVGMSEPSAAAVQAMVPPVAISAIVMDSTLAISGGVLVAKKMVLVGAGRTEMEVAWVMWCEEKRQFLRAKMRSRATQREEKK